MRTRSRRTITPVTGALTLALTVGALGAALVPAATSANAVTYAVRGVDVASWQHPSGKAINWSKVKGAGYSFAIIKATESTTYTNPYFAGDRSGAAQAGLVVGAYHFARPALPLSTASAQARYFARAIGTQQLSRTLPPILDIESTGGLSKANLARWMSTFLTTLRTSTGRTPMIYSYDSFLRTNVANVNAFSGYPLWYANYRSTPPTSIPGAWAKWHIWQHSSTASVPGISGDTDVNRFYGTYTALLGFASGKVGARMSQNRIQVLEPARVTGRVDPSFVGELIVLQTKGKRWTYRASQRITSSGAFSFNVALSSPGSRTYRVALVASSPYAHIHSDPVSVRAFSPWIKAYASTTSLKKGRTAHVYGTVDAFYAGAKVVRQKRTSSGRWVTITTKRVTSSGHFDFAVKPPERGVQSFRVVLRDYSPPATATSRTLKLNVR